MTVHVRNELKGLAIWSFEQSRALPRRKFWSFLQKVVMWWDFHLCNPIYRYRGQLIHQKFLDNVVCSIAGTTDVEI